MKIELKIWIDTIKKSIQMMAIQGEKITDVWLGHLTNIPPPQSWDNAKEPAYFVIMQPESMLPQYLDTYKFATVNQIYTLMIYLIRKGTQSNSMIRLDMAEDFLKAFENVAIDWPFECLVSGSIEFFPPVTSTEEDKLNTIIIKIPLGIKLRGKRQIID
jgi:hypothetical protein